jgi:hypothetical protein
VSAFANVPPNVVDDVFGGDSGLEDLAYSKFFELWYVLIGNDSAHDDEHIVELFSFHELHDPWAKRHVRPGKDRKPDDVDIFLEGRSDDLLGRLAKPRIDDFETGIAKGASYDFGAAIVSIESGFGDEHANAFRHQNTGSS